MSADQVAKAAQDSQIIQSQGDTNIGYSADDMKGIIETLADQVPKFAAIATAIVEARLISFEEKVMSRFEETATANSQAFADPDFQYILSQAQKSYARSGDDQTADVLVDLIAQRSVQPTRSRLSLSLNTAVEKSALLTKNEFAELSLAYLLRRTVRNTITNFPDLCEYLKTTAQPFVPDISKDESSYSYLASQACGSIEIGNVSFMTVLQHAYGGLVSNGFDINHFESVLGEDAAKHNPQVVMPCIHDTTKSQINAMNKEVLENILNARNLSDKLEPLWQIHASAFMSKEQFSAAAKPYYPEIDALIDAWDETPIKSFAVNSVGLAIGYANLRRMTSFDADLSVWIK